MRRVRLVVNLGANQSRLGRAVALLVALLVLAAVVVFIGAWLVLALAVVAVAAIGSVVVLALRGGRPARLRGRRETTIIEAEPARRLPDRDEH